VTSRSGGDARYMGAQGLGFLREKAAKSERAVEALRKATSDPDPMLQKFAKDALAKIGVKEKEKE